MKWSLTTLLLVSLNVALVAAAPGTAPLSKVAPTWSARVWFDPWRDVLLIRNESHSLSWDVATGLAWGDDGSEWRLTPQSVADPLLDDKDLNALDAWFRSSKTPVPRATSPVEFPPERSGSNRRVQVLVLDAGHGGSDPGSLGHHTINGKSVTLQEKDLTLAVVLELNRLLTKAYPDRKIILTRNSDTYPTLEERVKIAHAAKLGPHDSILFLSVHFNASLNKNASGLEFWYVPHDFSREVITSKDVPESVFPVLNSMVDDEFKKESQELATNLARGLAKELGNDQIQRGLKENPWFVVRMARMPAVLAELGFITNPSEAELLADSEYLKKLAAGLYTGLASFIQSYEDLP